MIEGAEPVDATATPQAGPGALRLVLTTLAITAVYLVLQNAWLWVSPFMAAPFDARTEADWPREAAAVATASRAADAALPTAWRHAAWRLGFQIGYAGHLLGSFSMSAPETRAKAQQLVAPKLQDAQRLADLMGLGTVAILPVKTASDFAREDDRIEGDELGIAARIQTRLSARHRHLFLLGMFVGVATAVAEGSGGALHAPKRLLIGRHATVAGVPASAWEGAAHEPAGATTVEKLKTYVAAVLALDAAIARLPAQPP